MYISPIKPNKGDLILRESLFEATLGLAFTRYCFTSQLHCGRQPSLYCPPLPAYPIAILVPDHCATYAPAFMPYTIPYW